jgi:hypothetical protein
MRIIAVLALLLLAGCATLTPTTVDPTVNVVANDVMAIAAAAAGDCSIPLGSTANTVDAACQNVNVPTSDLQATTTAVNGCLRATAGSVAAGKVAGAAAGLKAQLCLNQPTVTVPLAPSPSVAPAKPATKP